MAVQWILNGFPRGLMWYSNIVKTNEHSYLYHFATLNKQIRYSWQCLCYVLILSMRERSLCICDTAISESRRPWIMFNKNKTWISRGVWNAVFSCDEAALRTLLSVCPSVTPFSLCSHHRFTIKFSGVITIAISDVHAKCKGQISKVKVTDFKILFSRFQTVNPVWIHIWQWTGGKILMWHRRCGISFFKVIRQISRSHKIGDFDHSWVFADCNSSFNSNMATEWCTKLEVA